MNLNKDQVTIIVSVITGILFYILSEFADYEYWKNLWLVISTISFLVPLFICLLTLGSSND